MSKAVIYRLPQRDRPSLIHSNPVTNGYDEVLHAGDVVAVRHG